ncbi:hypothetical protein MRQ36_13135 [Micromonospora sp. R77]|uniref:TolB family protein n=1 Tax=Micromonospora sp. R77 TaxID=2925836 RepID=UPI001F61D397|nr:hypothetical protein [Micromonospora sp. R77]MCI4063471.1 hypothetical protein [Micromonospora sp. R77]
MNHDRLRSDLAGLADEVTPVDLRDRALRTSRRLGIQRTVATTAAALVLLAAATGTALAVRPNGSPPPAPAGPSITGTTPGPDSTPTRAPSTEPSAGPSSPAPDAGESGPAARIGRVFYGAAPGTQDVGDTRLRSWTPGGAPVSLLSMPTSSAWANAAVSPDGERVAWVDRDATLWVADVDGSNRRKLHSDVDGLCWGPTWHPDGKTLSVALNDMTGRGDITRGNLDVRTGNFTKLSWKQEGCHPLASADGHYLAYPDGSTGRVFVTTAGGKVVRTVPGLGGSSKYDCFDVASLSPDGSRIALFRRGPGDDAGDVARELTADAVLDTRTGAELDLPLGPRTLDQAFFQSDGTIVARALSLTGNVLVLIGANGRKISEEPEPSAFSDMQIIAVAG